MARSNNFSNSFGSWAAGILPGQTQSTLPPVAKDILERFKIPNKDVVGDPLVGYDIKCQDAVSMMKLSVLAENMKGNGSNISQEVYIDRYGDARVIKEGITGDLRYQISSGYLKSTIPDIQHFIVRPGQQLPTRYFKDSISIMGAGRGVSWQNLSCGLLPFAKAGALGQEAWAMFGRSQQSPETQELLRNAVKRSEWEQSIGYVVQIPNIPAYCSMSISQSTPMTYDITGNLTSILDATAASFNVSSDPYSGQIIDISNVNILGSPVLDLIDGLSLQEQFQQYLAADPFPRSYTKDDYFVLLDHQCGLQGLSRGTEWFVFPDGSLTSASVYLRSSSSSKAIWDIYNGAFNSVTYFRRNHGKIASIGDLIKSNVSSGRTAFDSFSPDGIEERIVGLIIPGIGGNWGMEVFGGHIAATLASPSIQIRSPFGDAPSVASTVAAGGVFFQPIVTQEVPPSVGYNGKEVAPKAPPDKEGKPYNPDTAIDNLIGGVLEVGLPFLSIKGAVEASKALKDCVLQIGSNKLNTFFYLSISYGIGGYSLLPGQKVGFYDAPSDWGDKYVIENIEFIYSDKDIVSTNITTGPLYATIGSWGDSKYIKRSETISRQAFVTGGNNEEGAFSVSVDGLGDYIAFNTTLECVYPGDRVEVKISNIPVEV